MPVQLTQQHYELVASLTSAGIPRPDTRQQPLSDGNEQLTHPRLRGSTGYQPTILEDREVGLLASPQREQPIAAHRASHHHCPDHAIRASDGTSAIELVGVPIAVTPPTVPSVEPTPRTFAEILATLDGVTIRELIEAQAAFLPPVDGAPGVSGVTVEEVPEVAQDLVRTGRARSTLMLLLIALGLGAAFLFFTLGR